MYFPKTSQSILNAKPRRGSFPCVVFVFLNISLPVSAVHVRRSFVFDTAHSRIVVQKFCSALLYDPVLTVVYVFFFSSLDPLIHVIVLQRHSVILRQMPPIPFQALPSVRRRIPHCVVFDRFVPVPDQSVSFIRISRARVLAFLCILFQCEVRCALALEFYTFL